MRMWSAAIFTAGVLAVLVAPAGIADDRSPKPYQNHSVLIVKRIPNATEAVDQLSRLSGIERVFANRKSRKITFELKANSTPSALEIWQLAEELNLEPVRLVTAQQIYTTRPNSDVKPKTNTKKKRQGSDR